MSPEAGILYIVSTPIGNLEDITLRAVDVLKRADRIACEDTRHAGKLLAHYGIDRPKASYHDHNERQRTPELLACIDQGGTVALISDAGTPIIQDPGWWLVRKAIEAGYRVEWIPGAVAAVGALVLSGLPAERFVFEGFLPSKASQRRKRLESLKGEERTIIFYESPYRVVRALEDIHDVFGDVPVSCSRELTKKFEETVRGTVSAVLEKVRKKNPKGEYVIVLNAGGGARLSPERNG